MWDAQRIVEPDWFLDRRPERIALRALVEQRSNVLIYGPRRLGKSSLIRRVAADLPDRPFLLVNCQFADSEETLSRLLLAETRQTGLAKRRQFLDWARQAARGLEIGIEIHEDRVFPVVRSGARRPRPLEDALEFITRVAEAAKTHIVIVLDEFQSIMGTHATVAKLREHAQGQSHVSYLVAGSQPSVLMNLTRHESPFWRQLIEFPLGPIDVAEALGDVSRRTQATVPKTAREVLQDVTRGNTQRLAELLETSWARHGGFTEANVREALGVVLGRHAAEFERLVEQRTTYQRQVLVAMAVDEPEHPTGTRFIGRHNLRGPGFVQKAMKALRRVEILADDGSFVDPLFAWWLRGVAPEAS